MAKAEKRDIAAFLALKRVAVVGVSRNRASYSRMVFRALKERGYDVAPVNPAAVEIDGVRCFATLEEVRPEAEAALILTRPESYSARAAECRRANVAAVWFRQKGEALEGALVVEDECPLMWLRGTGWLHRFHRRLRQWAGTMPG